MALQEFGLLIMSILMSVAGQFFLKAGALKLGRVGSHNLVGHVMSILTTPELLSGLTCYALGAISYILLLTRVNLSIAGPAVALIYVFNSNSWILGLSRTCSGKSSDLSGDALPQSFSLYSGKINQIRALDINCYCSRTFTDKLFRGV